LALDVLRPAEAETILPVLAPSPPVDAARREHRRRAVRVVDVLVVPILPGGRRHRRPDLRAIICKPGDGQNVADAALYDLKLDRPQPRAVEVLAGIAEPSLGVQ
jgi:hypothetical protein